MKIVRVTVKNTRKENSTSNKRGFDSRKVISVCLKISDLEAFNRILYQFDYLTRLNAIVFSTNVKEDTINVGINIHFPTGSTFNENAAYNYLASLFDAHDIKYCINGINGKEAITPITKYQMIDKANNDDTIIMCHNIKRSLCFDDIISMIENLHDIIIEIIHDSTDYSSGVCNREVCIIVPNCAITDLVRMLNDTGIDTEEATR